MSREPAATASTDSQTPLRTQGAILPDPADAAAQQRLRRLHGLARLVLAAFVFTFVIARILVILIMGGKLPPQLFFHLSGTHVHHLNYGIFMLSAIGGYMVFAGPTGRRLSIAAILYGIGLGLTFDEFGMWLHLGGAYWQRASFDAVIIVTGVLALLAFGTTLRRWRAHHHLVVVVMAAVLIVFAVVLHKSMDWANERIGPVLLHLEYNGPP